MLVDRLIQTTEAQDKDVNLEIINTQMIMEAMRMSQIIHGRFTYREECIVFPRKPHHFERQTQKEEPRKGIEKKQGREKKKQQKKPKRVQCHRIKDSISEGRGSQRA